MGNGVEYDRVLTGAPCSRAVPVWEHIRANHHALTVDVLYLQPANSSRRGGGIQRHEERAVIEIAGRVDQSGHFLQAEHGRQSLAGFGKWMHSARKCRRSVFTNKKRNADTY